MLWNYLVKTHLIRKIKKSFFMFFKLVNNVIPFYCKFSVSHIRVRLVLKSVSYTHQLNKDVPKYRELHYLLYK